MIIGSVREGRFGPTVAQWFVDAVHQFGQFELDVIDLADARLPSVITGEAPPEVTALQPRIAEADAFVMVTPEYNRGYPASVKTLIDWYVEEWRAKPVGFVSYGGRGGALRSVDHLGSVFSDLHAVPLRDTVSFHSVETQFDSAGRVRAPEECGLAAKTLLMRLLWWSTALSDARAAHPYQT
ncbi:NAD(P)H-dependent oxidoreductase [Microtetraspora sp. NBRC 13810]|uniref:NADPH-dependent FMN reductase n=1 Tax=Microtetraspora sp. NBRC 13810 TaxID=3030990 RepID=UPI002557966E|nr:NAD(P)H-dependent oxidoreductase [Microtetraspora sp. NBRC 13810]